MVHFDSLVLGIVSVFLVITLPASAQEQAILTASNGSSSSKFGWSVSISGDYAVVGAYEDDAKGGKRRCSLHFQTRW